MDAAVAMMAISTVTPGLTARLHDRREHRRA